MTEDTDRREKYVDKVRKLLAKAEATTVQAEADAFYAKATQLITEWRIEDAELAAAGGSQDTLATHIIQLGTYTPVADMLAVQSVMSALGIRCAFQAYGGPGHPPRCYMYGWQGDIDKALLLWTSIEVQLASSCRRAEPKGMNRSQQRVWRQSFKRGFADVTGKRLREMQAATIKVAQSKTPGTGLALVDKQSQVDRYFEGLTGKGRRTSMKTDARGVTAGATAARNADLGGTKFASTSRKELG